MRISESPAELELRAELRAYFAKLMTPEIYAATRNVESGPVYHEVVRQLGRDGWLGLSWPKEYGGQDRSVSEQLIFFEEARRSGTPLPILTLNTVGPAIMKYGSDEQKQKFLPAILRGEVHFAIGYTEPEAGTDLASLETRAVRDGEDYVINGTKCFTSGAEGADYIWLAARTDPERPKHKGISVFIVDTKLPGFSFTPIEALCVVHTNMTYYDNVRVPAAMLVGALNEGWRLVTAQLNRERISLAAFSMSGSRYYSAVLAWAREQLAEDGRTVAEQPWVQTALAEAYCRLKAMRLMNARMAAEMDQGQLDPAKASAVKVFATEGLIDVCRLLLEVTGTAGALRDGSAGALFLGDLECEYRIASINTFGGGSNEIQREIVAMKGLGMPSGMR